MKQETIKTILENKKLVVNGVGIKLTNEQLKQFEGLVGKPKHKMSIPNKGEIYFTVQYDCEDGYHVERVTWNDDIVDNAHLKNNNCYIDFELAEQVAMDLNLQDKLRQFTYENGWKDEWLFDTKLSKFCIDYNVQFKDWHVETIYKTFKPNEVYFVDRNTCEKAIEEIVKPFCKENPKYRFNKGE